MSGPLEIDPDDHSEPLGKRLIDIAAKAFALESERIVSNLPAPKPETFPPDDEWPPSDAA